MNSCEHACIQCSLQEHAYAPNTVIVGKHVYHQVRCELHRSEVDYAWKRRTLREKMACWLLQTNKHDYYHSKQLYTCEDY